MRHGERRGVRVTFVTVAALLVLVASCLVGGLRLLGGTARQSSGEGMLAGGAGDLVGEPGETLTGGGDAYDEGGGVDPSAREESAAPSGEDQGLLSAPTSSEDGTPDAASGTSRQSGDVQQVATRLLASYRDAGNCVLASSGYLDLFGSVWGCVVRGDRWVDICIVSETEEGSSCEVRVMRLDEDEVAESLGGVGDEE